MEAATATSILSDIAQKDIVLAFMVAVILAGAWYVRKTEKSRDARELAQEKRYADLLDKFTTMMTTQTQAVTEALVSTREVMRRVEELFNVRKD